MSCVHVVVATLQTRFRSSWSRIPLKKINSSRENERDIVDVLPLKHCIAFKMKMESMLSLTACCIEVSFPPSFYPPSTFSRRHISLSRSPVSFLILLVRYVREKGYTQAFFTCQLSPIESYIFSLLSPRTLRIMDGEPIKRKSDINPLILKESYEQT